MTIAAKPLFGQTLGLTQQALGVLARRALERAGTDFETWMVLNALAQNQEPHNAARVVDLLAQAPVAIEALIDGLVKHGLAYRSGDTSINLTPAGAMRHASLRETLQDVSQTVLAAVDASELETARRVLETVTERAKELAATG